MSVHWVLIWSKIEMSVAAELRCATAKHSRKCVREYKVQAKHKEGTF